MKYLVSIVVVLLVGFLFLRYPNRTPDTAIHDSSTKNIEFLTALKPNLEKNLFPATIEENATLFHVHYTIEPILQKEMDTLLKSYRPDYGAIVALDPKTGKVLVSSDYSKYPIEKSLTLRASFPAASLFKLVTASMAIDLKKATAESSYPLRGSHHTLYRRNVTSLSSFGPHITLKEAFAKSVNSIFGKIGYFDLTPKDFEIYTERFLFNTDISSEIPVEKGLISFEKKDSWELAEIASGYNQKVMLSPMQAALIASLIPNGGVIFEPHVIEAAFENQKPVYSPTMRILSSPVTQETIYELKKLMRETVTHGTSRNSFRDLLRNPFFKEMDIGGKTGSLSGNNPKGKYDWFIGYAEYKGKVIAFSCLTINENYWKVKASYLARKLIEKYFEEEKIAYKKTRRGS